MFRAAPTPPPPVPVRLLALLLVCWVPLSFAWQASVALERLMLYGIPAILLLLARVVVAGVAIAAGRALWTVAPSALRLARAWLVLDVLVTAVTLATPYFPSNRLPGGRTFDFLVVASIDGAWFLYLTMSERVRSRWSRA